MSKSARQIKKSDISVTEDSEDFKMIRYSLKMSLRMTNAKFDMFEIKKINDTGVINFQQTAKDKTTVDCWLKPTPDQHQNIAKNNGLIFTHEQP